MMSQRASRLAIDLNDLREYDSSFADPATSGQDNIADRCVRVLCIQYTYTSRLIN